MKFKFSMPVKLLLATASSFFIIGFASLFFQTIEADVISVLQLVFHQQGYSGLPHSNFNGSSSSLLVAEYQYEVASKKYRSWGLAISGYGESLSIKYFPWAPALSVVSSAPYFMAGFFFLFIGFGIRSFIVWCKTIVHRHSSQ
ncbi:hypothetical protein [Arenicella xantha]|uniref:DUF3592 domain-containing protein n=1 Tax=Arenicella xantha TaxID=644221 RepID=A0A395JK90_9GAMM|nr:hypothetical protein [Arenicella xantha]RBP49322.1 hypothetical protein DFR28_104253 [Arenicella xantha]